LLTSSKANLLSQLDCRIITKNFQGESGIIQCIWIVDNKYTPQSLKFTSSVRYLECPIKNKVGSCLYNRVSISIQESEAYIRVNDLRATDTDTYKVEVYYAKENTDARYYIGLDIFLSVT
ncbi:hypothetical protein BgiMline_013924, partial [Biomphalaria glabrata]